MGILVMIFKLFTTSYLKLILKNETIIFIPIHSVMHSFSVFVLFIFLKLVYPGHSL